MPQTSLNTAEQELPHIDQFLTYRMNILSSLLNRQVERFLSQQFDMSLPDWRIVANLGATQDLSVRDLARQTQMDKALVSRATARLVKRGLVSTRPDQKDGRLVVLALTEAGKQLYQTIMPAAWQHQQQSFACLSEQEQQALNKALEKLTAVAVNHERQKNNLS